MNDEPCHCLPARPTPTGSLRAARSGNQIQPPLRGPHDDGPGRFVGNGNRLRAAPARAAEAPIDGKSGSKANSVSSWVDGLIG